MRRIIKLFERGSVSVFGQRGTGKDVLFGNVIARRKKPYTSNLYYGGTFTPLDLNLLNMSGNTYRQLISGKPIPFDYPENQKCNDIYISDVGAYLPSQFCNELNRDYKGLPLFFALSRQIAHLNVHTNTQFLGRPWDKLREQSDIYVNTRKCIFFGKLVFMKVRLYEKYESALATVPPFRMRRPILGNSTSRMLYETHRDSYINTHGEIKQFWIVFPNRSNHDTYYFEKFFKGDKTNNENPKQTEE